MDIGIMPLPNNQATLGKSGFKLLQYMGLGIVPIASAVGINREIINDSVNGFLVENETDWLAVFEKAISKRNDWASIGKIGQEEIKKQYTFEANYLRYDAFLKHVSKAL
jgi:glycosyltransferase involved in cell wall biosynthesis